MLLRIPEGLLRSQVGSVEALHPPEIGWQGNHIQRAPTTGEALGKPCGCARAASEAETFAAGTASPPSSWRPFLLESRLGEDAEGSAGRLRDFRIAFDAYGNNTDCKMDVVTLLSVIVI